MWLKDRAADIAIAGVIAAVAAAISPIGIRLATGRLDLSPRIIVLSVTFDLFLLMFAGAALARGSARRVCLHLAAWVFPLALLAAIETAAIVLKLADRIAPVEDLSVLADAGRWPPYLMSLGRKVSVQRAERHSGSHGDGAAPRASKAAAECWPLELLGLGRKETDELELYRPWHGDGISINELGLRTAAPSPKAPGEWRIAVAGASAAWGWRVLDVDTIPVRLQALLREQGHPNVTVFNFAIDSMLMADELEVVKRFRDVYAIDQVVFYTGANDVTSGYLDATAPRDCRAATLRCDIILQPVLPARQPPHGPEIPLAHTLAQVYPRYAEAFATVYRSVKDSVKDLGPDTGVPVHDLSDLFDRSAVPYFFDAVHVNEAGNAYAAEQIAGIVAAGIPDPAVGASKDR